MTDHAAKAAEHAQAAEEVMTKIKPGRGNAGINAAAHASIATAHATLALYYQREADRTRDPHTVEADAATSRSRRAGDRDELPRSAESAR